MKKIPIAVFASGQGSNLQAIIDFAHKKPCHFYVAAVIANVKNAYALTRAERAYIPHFLVEHTSFLQREDFERALLKILNLHHIQVVVLAGFMRVLSPTFLAEFSGRVLNVHPSILPKFPGLRAIEQAVRAGEREIGCTVHLVDEQIDHGLILGQSTCTLDRDLSLEHIKSRVHALEHELLPAVTDEFCRCLLKE